MSDTPKIHSISVVIPVYNGRETLPSVINNLARFTSPSISPAGNGFVIKEVILVFDCGTDGSESMLRNLKSQFDFVRVIWLTRNFGQHAATLAGMAATTTDWIVTIDEDGQQDCSDISRLLDVALADHAQLVYAKPLNPAPHGKFRNFASRLTKGGISRFLTGGQVANFTSFRLIQGEVGRILSAYVGHGVYLDVALHWIVKRSTVCEVNLVLTESRKSTYSKRGLLSHFWRLVISSGTRLLRIASVIGALSFIGGLVTALVVVTQKFRHGYSVTGWASVFVAILLIGGLILLVLGIIAEYIGLLVRTNIGQPLYVVSSKDDD